MILKKKCILYFNNGSHNNTDYTYLGIKEPRNFRIIYCFVQYVVNCPLWSHSTKVDLHISYGPCAFQVNRIYCSMNFKCKIFFFF